MDWLADKLNEIANYLLDAVKGLFEWLWNLINGAIQALIDTVASAYQNLVDFLDLLWLTVQGWIWAVLVAIKEAGIALASSYGLDVSATDVNAALVSLKAIYDGLAWILPIHAIFGLVCTAWTAVSVIRLTRLVTGGAARILGFG